MVLKVDVSQDRKIYCLQARPYICQPGILQAGAVKGLILIDMYMVTFVVDCVVFRKQYGPAFKF